MEDEPGLYAYQLLSYGERIYVARGDGLWYWTVTATGVEESENPGGFELYQNFPNPFNPETAISYELSANSYAKLTVYDLLGRVAAVLVDETLPAGKHRAVWNAGGHPSGIYFLRLESGGLVETRKMMLVR